MHSVKFVKKTKENKNSLYPPNVSPFFFPKVKKIYNVPQPSSKHF
jgi:hypothetical protein